MQYNIVFDVNQVGYRYGWSSASGLIVALISAGLMYLICKLKSEKPGCVVYFTLVCGVIWSGDAFIKTLREYLSLSSALRNNRCEIVEGQITQFHPMPITGHDVEFFNVGDRHFEYSDYDERAGFNNTSSRGGPLKDDSFVRIYCVGNNIARLEIGK